MVHINLNPIKVLNRTLILLFFLSGFHFNYINLYTSQASIQIINNSNDTLLIYKDPLSIVNDGIFLQKLKPKSRTNIISNKWIRTRYINSGENYDIKVSNYSKNLLVTNDTFQIENVKLDKKALSNKDSIIYLKNELYLEEESETYIIDIDSLDKNFDYIHKNIDLIPVSYISSFIYRNLPLFKKLNILNNTNISDQFKKYYISKLIEYYSGIPIEKNMKKLKTFGNKLKQNHKNLYNYLIKNDMIKYCLENTSFYDKLTKFLKEKNIEVDTSKDNLFYFSASWCAPCYHDFKKMSNMNFDLKDTVIYLIAFEYYDKDVAKIKMLISDINIDLKLIILKGSIQSYYNKYLNIWLVPQLYRLRDKKFLDIYLSEYLEEK